MIPAVYNVRSLVVRKTTTIATAVGVGLVVFVFCAALMLTRGLREALALSGKPENAIVLRKGSDAEMSSGITPEQVVQVLAAPGVARSEAGQPIGCGELVVVAAINKLGTGGVSNVQIRGVPDNVRELRPEVHILEGRPARPGTDEVIVGKGIHGNFEGVKLGEQFELKKNRPVSVVGVFEAGGSSYESEVWADVETVRAAFGREGRVSSVRVRLASPEAFRTFEAAVEAGRGLGLEAMGEVEFLEQQSEGTAIFLTAMGMVIAVFFSIGAIIGAAITMYGAVANRRREIGTLRALGFSRRAILASFLFESMVLALAGGVLGCVAAVAMGLVRFSTMNFNTWSEISFRFQPTPGILTAGLVFAAVMGVAGGFFPAVRAARLPPIEAMRRG